MIVCIKQALRKKHRRHCFIDYVKESEQKSLGHRKVSVVHITDSYIRWVFVRTNETVCYTVDVYGCPFEVGVQRADFHCTDEPPYAVSERP